MTTWFPSFTGKRWILQGQNAPLDPWAALAKLREERGIADEPDARIAETAALLPGAARAAERIKSAISRGEHIGIFGDYDCDGITAVAELVRFLRRRNAEPVVRLPHRVHDGYGLTTGIIEEFRSRGVSCLITADTGITAVEEIRHAQQRGIDVIVTDHHTPPASLPPAFALVHPGIAAGYPPPFPSGAGVVFLLIALMESGQWQGYEEDLSLAATGMIADLVELTGRNRTLVQHGLRALGEARGSPIAELAELAGVDPRAATSTDIAFRIAPRINASGRIASPDLALRALLHGGQELHDLDALNRQRQMDTEEQLSHALECIRSDHAQHGDAPLLSALDAEYHHGIIGLIAGKLTELSGKPSIVATADGETCTASLRSPPCYHITEGLTRCQSLLTRFGGHAQAAGCTFPRQHWEELCRQLAEDICERTTPDDLVPTLLIDAHINAATATLAFVETLRELEPFGQGNREPLFLMRNVRLANSRAVGASGAHLQARAGTSKVIGFGMGKFLQHCNAPLDIICRFAVDTWQGTRSPQIILADARAATAESRDGTARHLKTRSALGT